MDNTVFVLTFPEPAPANENDIIFQVTRQDLMHICLAVTWRQRYIGCVVFFRILISPPLLKSKYLEN